MLSEVCVILCVWPMQKKINFLMPKKTRKKFHTQYCLPQFCISACGTPPHLWVLLCGISSCGLLTGYLVSPIELPQMRALSLDLADSRRTADQESEQRLHGDDAVFKRTCWACRGPEFGSWHLSRWFTTLCDSCSGGSHGFLWLPSTMHSYTQTHTHTHAYTSN